MPNNFVLLLSGLCLAKYVDLLLIPNESDKDFTCIGMLTAQWRKRLHELDGFPLLPCGAGEKGKAPMNPDTALPLKDWQRSAYTPQQINEMPSYVICVGTRTGPEAGNLLIIDIDGESALDYCIKSECLVEDSGWKITRDTDATRLKVAFRMKDDGLSDQLAAHGKIIFSTSDAPKEQVELFYGNGQCIVLGQHLDSGGNYLWSGLPRDMSEPTQAWEKLIRNLINTKQVSYNKKISGDSWKDCIPCPICGRTEEDCRIRQDGGFIQCHQGNRWNPPNLLLGQTITRDGVTWAYVGESKNAIGQCSNFTIDQKKDSAGYEISSQVFSSIDSLDIRSASRGGADVGKVDWLIEGFAAMGIVLLAAEPGTGKTTLLYRAAEAIQEGTEFLDSVPVQQGSVLVIQGDEPKNVTIRKMKRMDLKRRFDILFDDHSLDMKILSEVVRSKKWRVLVVDSLTTVLASSSCTTMDLAMADRLYELNKLASENNVLILMTAHLNKPSKDGSGARMKRKIIDWADISGVATISAAVNDAWGLTQKDNLFSLRALGKRHVLVGVEWILERFEEDFYWELKQVTDSLMPKQEANIKLKIISFLEVNMGQFFTTKEICEGLHLSNEEHVRRCLYQLFDAQKVNRRKRPSMHGRPPHEYGLNG